MGSTKLIPYSLNLPAEHVNRLKEMSKLTRGGSSFVRDAIAAKFDGLNDYNSGYNNALRDVCKVIEGTKEAYIVLIGNDRLGDILIENVRMLEQNGK
jgi:predicted DNA-binding protein